MKLLLALLAPSAWAYPHYIGYGYPSCTTCHFNAFGGGPLTDYGRALSATTVSARPFFQPRADDEKLAEQSGFLGPVEFPSWLRLAADYRGLDLRTGLEAEKTAKRWIHMQAEGSATLILKENRLWASGTFGYVPVPQTVPAGERANSATWISREHYVAYKPSKPLAVYGGMLDPAYGLRVADHTAFIRSRTARNINDQTHGLLLHLTGRKWDAGAHGMLGNLFQEPRFRLRGGSVLFEYDVASKFRVGASALHAFNEFRNRTMAGIIGKAGFGQGSAVLTELSLIQEKPKAQDGRWGDAFFLQGMTRIVRGVYALLTLEQYTDNLAASSTRVYRAGPSIQYFPFQRLELRMDLLGSRVIGIGSTAPDTFALQSQVHLWL